MKRILSILASTVSLYSLFGGADSVAASAVPAPALVVPAPAAVVPAPAAVPEAPKPISFFSQIKLPEEKKITCQEAFENFIKNKLLICDFYRATDFGLNGDHFMSEVYNQVVSTKAFGTDSPNLYFNLCRTGVNTEILSKWLGRGVQDGRVIGVNASGNDGIGDDLLTHINLKNISVLNLDKTSISDAFVNGLSAKITAEGIGNLKRFSCSGCSRVTSSAVESLKAAIKAKAPDAGDGIVSYEPAVPAPIPALAPPQMPAPVVAAAPVAVTASVSTAPDITVAAADALKITTLTTPAPVITNPAAVTADPFVVTAVKS